MAGESSYYVPEQSKWPIIAAFALFLTVFGAANWINQSSGMEEYMGMAGLGVYTFIAGMALLLYMFYGWFGQVIEEDMAGMYSAQLNRSFVWGMGWFIFSEVMFFAAFFGTLWYVRNMSVPWLGGEGAKGVTNMLWEGFQSTWPVLSNPDNVKFVAPTESMNFPGWSADIYKWLPLVNTVLLLSSSWTVHLAHNALKADNRGGFKLWLTITVLLGFTFVGFQAEEYIEAYHMGLTLDSGIYGSTFFMLTGFHGFHVTMGATMLLVMLIRGFKGHFKAESHFGFEAASWYWHFVDVVWVFLFLFVYIL